MDTNDRQQRLNCAKALQDARRFVEAEDLYRQILGSHPALGEVRRMIGDDAFRHRDFPSAAAVFALAVAADPGDASAHNSLGHALRMLNRPLDAEVRFRRALEITPGNAGAYNDLALALKEQGRVDEAVSACRQAVALDPDYVKGHIHLAECLLLNGELKEGFAEYEWRTRLPEITMPGNRLEQPRWDGGPIAGKTLLVIGEQGFGDTIQFCRYASLLRPSGARIILAVQETLKDLCRSLEGVDHVAAGGETLPPFDLHVPLLSLPHMLATTLETIPAPGRYLKARRDKIDYWRRELADKPGLRVGIAWQGTSTGAADRGRSIPLAHFQTLPGVRLLSLQKGCGSEQLEGSAVEDIGSRCRTFEDTAAVMENLDLVITSDTAVAHLAGALGRPAWAALMCCPDWRWLLGRRDSPWYPTMRLFRQRTPGDWEQVFREIARALKEL